MGTNSSRASLLSTVVKVLIVTNCIYALSCGSAANFKSNSSDQGSQGTDPNPTPTPGGVPIPPDQSFALASVPDIALPLAMVRDFQVAFSVSSGFRGIVNFSVDRPELDAVDPAKDIVTTVTPAQANFNGGETIMLNVRVEVKSSAPDFNEHFHILALESGVARPLQAINSINLRVIPTIEIDLMGGNAPEVFAPAISRINIRPHTGGVTVRFVNLDRNSTHIIHGQGGIPHQNVNLPLAVATSAAPGGLYEVRVTSATPNLNATYYCHTHESSAQGKNIVFNFQ